jgi:hypothetical protein
MSAAPLWAQVKKTQSFVLNPAKPYAYIVFDHAGQRPPLCPGESSYGYWLRLVNNSTLPIEVTVFATNYPKPGAGDVLLDEVVKFQGTRFFAAKDFPFRPSPTWSSMPPLNPPGAIPVHSKPSKSKSKIKTEGSPTAPAKPPLGCPTVSGEPPEGYEAETASVMDIEPGKSLLFSIPSNQLSPDWYIQVKFNLDIIPGSPVEQPDTYVYFDWWHLPETVRQLCK